MQYKIGEQVEVFGKKFIVVKIGDNGIVDLKPLESSAREKKGNHTKGKSPCGSKDVVAPCLGIQNE